MTISPQEDVTLGASSEFMRSLWRFNHVLERVSRKMEEVRGVTVQQRLILRFVGKYPGSTASQLAAYFWLDPGTISASIARLEDKGLLSRRRTSRDRRRVVLGLTPEGKMLDGERSVPVDGVIEVLIGEPSGDPAGPGHTLESLTASLAAVLDPRVAGLRRGQGGRPPGDASAPEGPTDYEASGSGRSTARGTARRSK